MSVYPTQQRTVDPYSSYYSNIVNRLTRIISRGVDCLHSTHACDVALDATSPLTIVTMGSGEVFKDDVFLQFTSTHSINFEDSNNYTPTSFFNEAGYYYILLDYEYEKTKPAPQASIKIMSPSKTSTNYVYGGRYLFLKAVKVIFTGSVFEIESLHDYDPGQTDNKRVYSKLFCGVEDTLPTFIQTNDEARLIYVRDEDEMYFGLTNRWEGFDSIRDNIDTTACITGQLAYVDTSGIAQPAIASDQSTFADCAVLQVGNGSDGSGKVRLYGKVDNVVVESGITIVSGDKVYLSKTTAGAVTNLIPVPYSQGVGVCLEDGDTAGTIDIWFMPGSTQSGETFSNEYDTYQDLLGVSICKRLTADSFINADYIDATNTTAVHNIANHQIDGTVGTSFYSSDLTDSGYDGSCIVICQVSCEPTGSNTNWFVTNDGGIDGWEQTTLDQVHTFSTHKVPITGASGVFTAGELITGGSSGKTAIVASQYPTYLLLSYLSPVPSDFTGSETITGASSGETATINGSKILREGFDLRVRCDFSGTDTITSYGIIYDKDENLTETVPYNEYNIQTLYSDFYTTPSIDNDGGSNLVTPMETSKDNLQTFVGSTGDTDEYPDFSASYYMDSTASITNITEAIVILDNQLYDLSGLFLADSTAVDSLQVDVAALEISVSSIDSVAAQNQTNIADLDSTVTILISDVYEVKGDIYDNQVDIGTNQTNISNNQTDISNLANDVSALETAVDLLEARFVEGDDTPDVNTADIWLTNDSTSAITITNFDIDTTNVTKIHIIFDGSNYTTTIQHNNNIRLNSQEDYIGIAGVAKTFLYSPTTGMWHEI